MDKVGKLDRGFICKNFTGQVSSVIIFNDSIKADNIIELMTEFPKSVNAEKFLDKLDKNQKFSEDNIKEKLFGMFLPERVQKLSQGDIYVEFSSSTTRAKLGPLSG